jgi:ADP-heptose:LPS heptosyltransferase
LQLGAHREALACGLIDLSHEFESIDDTAAFISALDLVITIDGMIGHLAGALSQKSWVLVDLDPHYP